MGNLKTEYSKSITLETLEALYKAYGMAVEINDGAVVTAYFE